MYLTNEQREIGKINFLTALGTLRKDFLQKSLTAPAIGPYYFGYGKLTGGPVRAGIVGVGNEGCEAMIMQSSPSYLQYVAYHDIRPSQIARATKYFKTLYGDADGAKVKFYDKWQEMLADKDIEAIVIATPLWTHARLAIEAMRAGKHVLCEKLMAHNITDAKKMIQVADQTKKVLSIGHQRHYSTLYDNAMTVVRSGLLGEIRHIRALWHRNNTWLKPDGSLNDGWLPEIPDTDQSVDFRAHGYQSVKELVRWRLYNRTGGGLMAELGSHQLDACSLFLNKAHPLSVHGVGGKYYFDDDRECEDHVYCMYEMPNGVTLTYSSINTNTLEGYGEIITGSKGTLLIKDERDVMLFKERMPEDKERSQDMRLHLPTDEKKETKLAWSPSLSLPNEAALAKVAIEHASQFVPAGKKDSMVNRGYHEEIEAFAFAARNPEAQVRCNGRVALADTVMALAANVAMRSKKRLVFDKAWYEPSSDVTPDARPTNVMAAGS